MNDLQAVAIRAGEAADAESISMLVLELAERFVLPEFSSEGRERFSTAHTPAAIAALMESGYRYHVAECGGELVGVVGICGPSHLYHLFVAADMHGRGLGRRLWEVARVDWPASSGPRTWTVKASRYAVPVYERFGFVATGPLQAKGGILIVPMELREPADERVMTGDRAVLYFLCGKMAAGKSTHARRLAARRRAVLLVLDEFLAALYPGQVQSIADFVEYSARVRRALSPHIRTLLSQGVSVVLDFPGNTRTPTSVVSRADRRRTGPARAASRPASRRRRTTKDSTSCVTSVLDGMRVRGFAGRVRSKQVQSRSAVSRCGGVDGSLTDG